MPAVSARRTGDRRLDPRERPRGSGRLGPLGGVATRGRIPTLILDDGEPLIDSAAILDHLDELVGPDRALLPARGAERRRALQVIALAAGGIDKAAAYAYERQLRPPGMAFAPWLERCLVQLETGLDALEAATPETGWYLGRGPLQPDITVGCMLGYVDLRMRDVLPAGTTSPAKHPRLARLAADLDRVPAFRDTRPSDDEAKPGRPLA